MEIKPYVDPEEIRQFIVKKLQEIQADIIIYDAKRTDREKASFVEMPDLVFEVGKMHGSVDARNKILQELLDIIKK